MQGIVMSIEGADFGSMSLEDVSAWPILNVDDPEVYNPDGLCIYGVLPGGARVEFTIPHGELLDLLMSLEQKMAKRDMNIGDPFGDVWQYIDGDEKEDKCTCRGCCEPTVNLEELY